MWFFWQCVLFSYGHWFSVSIFYQLISEKNQVHTSDLTHCNQLINFFKSKTWRAIEEFASTNQVSLKYSDIFFLSYFKVYSFPHFTVFCSYVCLLSKQSQILSPKNARSIWNVHNYKRYHVINFIIEYDCSKQKCLTNITPCSFTLSPRRAPRVHKIMREIKCL